MDINREFLQKDIQMRKRKGMKRCSTPIVFLKNASSNAKKIPIPTHQNGTNKTENNRYC